MFYIEMANVQSIKSAKFHFEDNTLTEFTGGNSNGKSVLVKVIEALVSGDLKEKEERLPLIMDGTDGATILLQHNSKQLGIIIKEEVKETCVILTPDCDNHDDCIVRFVGEKGIDKLVYDFGFRVYDKGGICLQLAPTFGAVPFVTTSSTTNNEIVDDITKHRVADEFITAYETITYPILKSKVKQLRTREAYLEETISNMADYNYKEYGILWKKMKYTYDNLTHMRSVTLTEIPIVPTVRLERLPEVDLREILEIKTYNKPPKLIDMSSLLSTMEDIKNGTCPTCGKTLLEGV